MKHICPSCGQTIPPGTSDEAILRSLEEPHKPGKFGPIQHNLYVAAASWNTREADWTRWYVTGPDTRLNYVRGPFPHDQVKRLVATGKLVPDCTDGAGNVLSYVLRGTRKPGDQMERGVR